MQNFRLYIILLLSLISFVGLLIIQVNWLQKGISLQEQKFNHNICILLQDVQESLEKDSVLRNDIVAFLNEQKFESQHLIKPPQGSALDLEIRQILESFLRTRKIGLSYEYTFYNDPYSCEQDVGFLSNIDGEQIYHLQFGSQFNTHLHKSCDQVSQLHLGLIFPNKYPYLLKQVSSHLAIALVFILLLVGCLAYTVRTIYYQKKFARLKNDFINNLTHEFKTPIFSISLITKVFRQNLDRELATDRAQKYLELIEGENEQLKSHVEKVLQLAFLENARFELELKEVDLHDVIYKVVKFFEFLVEQRQGKLSVDLQAQHSIIEVDETHVSNLLHNLLDNALKYTHSKPEIKISTEDKENGIQLSVKDNGVGISQPDQVHIFEKFYRVSTGDVHQVKGFGLGLSYVKLVVEAHKGLIELKSRLHQGTEFQVFLPKN